MFTSIIYRIPSQIESDTIRIYILIYIHQSSFSTTSYKLKMEVRAEFIYVAHSVWAHNIDKWVSMNGVNSFLPTPSHSVGKHTF